ncbi:MogA/MoaB family molybdenum cofactor biosynthesis protein [Clostridium lacusfryxellense]|uniref:MogA/MoaB family molybdenum cofactor biosynthesis protein n=1 Tax=Clostridium lacusfryxellense TaxID=205328 RepID=UPI001C0D2675|nr:MogA/MoaB family molybdenum cofactor biosynthesis protein [Clostridium lacusfryxellense]MBU3109976.1 MogA/MoaB family molybdenum cofactor biosynthesis protein [Clostridium lacusfryxellense]
MDIKIALITMSDKGYNGTREDKSGPMMESLLKGQAEIVYKTIVPDERDIISKELSRIADNGLADIILTSGGTGFAPRDVTPEATMDIIERNVPGIPEAMRAYSMQKTNRAMLSRAVAGIRKKTLIINMPGSPKAVSECMEVILPILEHAVKTMRGETNECARV